jgi:hypothetical protein
MRQRRLGLSKVKAERRIHQPEGADAKAQGSREHHEELARQEAARGLARKQREDDLKMAKARHFEALAERCIIWNDPRQRRPGRQKDICASAKNGYNFG